MFTDDHLAVAIRNRVGTLFDAEPAEADWPLDRDFAADPIIFGDHALDSLDLIEVMMVLEEELNVQLLDSDDVQRLSSLLGVASEIARNADQERLADFCTRWNGCAAVA